MIVAAGLSPAWQAVMRFRALVPGEVNRARDVWRGASGKVLNVAIALDALGCPHHAVTVLGGAAGRMVADDCAEGGVTLSAVPTATATRTCTTLLDEASGRTTELVENAAPIAADELAAFVAAYGVAVDGAGAAVLSGSLPAATPATLYRELLARTRCPAILDARGPELLEALPLRPLLVKPNREELARTVGRELVTEDDVRGAIAGLVARGARWVVVTDGPRPVVVAGPDGGRWRIVPPRPPRVENPIGSGDCLAAGVAAALVAGREPLAAVVHGIACAADNCRTLLAGRLDPSEVARLESLVTVTAG